MKNWKRSGWVILFWGIAMISPALALGAQAVVTDDAYTTTGTRNFGDAGTLLVEGPSATTWLKFDLSGLPSGLTGTDVAKATVKLWVNTVGMSGSLEAQRVTGAWTEEGVTADSAPGLGAAEATGVAVNASHADGYLSVEVTQLAKDWLDGTLANEGLAIVPNPKEGISVEFDSKENGRTGHAPALEIVLNGPAGPQGPAGRRV